MYMYPKLARRWKLKLGLGQSQISGKSTPSRLVFSTNCTWWWSWSGKTRTRSCPPAWSASPRRIDWVPCRGRRGCRKGRGWPTSSASSLPLTFLLLLILRLGSTIEERDTSSNFICLFCGCSPPTKSMHSNVSVHPCTMYIDWKLWDCISLVAGCSWKFRLR